MVQYQFQIIGHAFLHTIFISIPPARDRMVVRFTTTYAFSDYHH